MLEKDILSYMKISASLKDTKLFKEIVFVLNQHKRIFVYVNTNQLLILQLINMYALSLSIISLPAKQICGY